MRVLTLNSNQINHFELNREDHTLEVELRDGHTVVHANVPDEMMRALILSEAKDRYYQAYIRDCFERV